MEEVLVEKMRSVMQREAMTYSEWNEHIAKIFYKPENAGRDILFYLTKQDLIKYSRWDQAFKYNKPANVPAIFKGDYQLVYRFDAETLGSRFAALNEKFRR